MILLCAEQLLVHTCLKSLQGTPQFYRRYQTVDITAHLTLIDSPRVLFHFLHFTILQDLTQQCP